MSYEFLKYKKKDQTIRNQATRPRMGVGILPKQFKKRVASKQGKKEISRHARKKALWGRAREEPEQGPQRPRPSFPIQGPGLRAADARRHFSTASFARSIVVSGCLGSMRSASCYKSLLRARLRASLLCQGQARPWLLGNNLKPQTQDPERSSYYPCNTLILILQQNPYYRL